MREPFSIGGREVAAGQREVIELPLPPLSTHSDLHMPVHVIHGRKSGPVLLVCAALHGDEINGIEVIRRLLKLRMLSRLHGTLIAVPIVNVYGFIHLSRYLPDRRDLNRSFPGSEKGSLAARLANLFMQEAVLKATHGIDLHSAAIHRDNYPQIRASLDCDETRKLAEAFRAPVILDAPQRPGTIREAAVGNGIPWLVYEAGEALRFDEVSIRAGVRGVVNVMRELGMLRSQHGKPAYNSWTVKSNSWVRAPQSGIVRLTVKLGASVGKGELIGYVSDPYGENEAQVLAPFTGVVIGRTNLPLIHEGDALAHLARFRSSENTLETLEIFQSEVDPAETEGLSGTEPIV